MIEELCGKSKLSGHDVDGRNVREAACSGVYWREGRLRLLWASGDAEVHRLLWDYFSCWLELYDIAEAFVTLNKVGA